MKIMNRLILILAVLAGFVWGSNLTYALSPVLEKPTVKIVRVPVFVPVHAQRFRAQADRLAAVIPASMLKPWGKR